VSGVYISYPFCAQKCTFCNFASGVGDQRDRVLYGDALLAEMGRHQWVNSPDTVYFGGGTPSLMPAALLERIFELIPANGLREVTLECAPGSLTREAVQHWRACGINRISLGVQSFASHELRQVGRRHTAEIVESDVELLRGCGISNINIDLIAGLPHQSEASWSESLRRLIQLKVPHVSVYLFELDEDSRLGQEALAGGARYGAHSLPNEEIATNCYVEAVRFLDEHGLRRYEISNFAVPGWESRHNLKYWHRETYVGFGLDAHSFDGRTRWSNPDELPDYLDGQGRHEESADAAEERFMLGLRLASGFQPTTAEWTRFADPITRWLDTGLLEKTGANLRLSDEGILVSNEILQEFIHVA
jgi:oxygen-independent coproporphyrinogen III oxidase